MPTSMMYSRTPSTSWTNPHPKEGSKHEAATRQLYGHIPAVAELLKEIDQLQTQVFDWYMVLDYIASHYDVGYQAVIIQAARMALQKYGHSVPENFPTASPTTPADLPSIIVDSPKST